MSMTPAASPNDQLSCRRPWGLQPCSGKRGHPVLFSWKHVEAVCAIPPDRGLNHLVAELAADVEQCPVDEPGLLDDLDTPYDYDRLRQRAWDGNA